MRWVLVLLMLAACAAPKTTAGDQPTPTVSPKQAILDYQACDGGMTVNQATGAMLKGAWVQEIKGIRYVTHDAKRWVYAIDYKAANGTEKSVDFNYTMATGKVAAENDDALAILRMMEAGCRQR